MAQELLVDQKELPVFVKWAGGKSQLLEQYSKLFPAEVDGYIEPFVGGGAVLFYVLTRFRPSRVIIGDSNEELINAYRQIRDNVEEVIRILKIHKKNHSERYYYAVRGLRGKKTEELEISEDEIWDADSLTDEERAARFIYLNRTCYNGLYRVNSSGQFNVPMGSYKNPGIVREQVLQKASRLLQNVKAVVQDFAETARLSKKGDLVYFDPPYDPVSESASFTSYTEDGFDGFEQKRLSDLFASLSDRGVKIMLSNSDTPFVHKLYAEFSIELVKATRMINCKGDNRGEINEVVVTNY